MNIRGIYLSLIVLLSMGLLYEWNSDQRSRVISDHLKVAEASGYLGKIEWDKSKPDGTPRKQLDISNIKQLGWKPKIGLDEGIKSTVNLYLEKLKLF